MRHGLVLFGIIFYLICSPSVFAANKVYSPIVHKGELEIETTGVYNIDHRKAKNGEHHGGKEDTSQHCRFRDQASSEARAIMAAVPAICLPEICLDRRHSGNKIKNPLF